MSITNYIIELKEKTGLSYMELAKQTGLSYQNIIDIKNDRIQTVSKSVLEKLSKYEQRDKQHILYDILYKDNENSLLHTHSKSTLIYLCDLYLNNYAIQLSPHYPSIIFNNSMHFEAMAYKKRITNSYLLIDSWEKLKSDHYVSENAYLYDILLYGIGKTIAVKDNALREYVIVFDQRNKADIDIVKGFEINKVNIKISYIYIEQ